MAGSQNSPSGLNGSYAVHGHDVDMKLANGSPYQKHRFAIEQDRKVLTLTTKNLLSEQAARSRRLGLAIGATSPHNGESPYAFRV